MITFTIQQSKLTKRLKKQILDGLTAHAITQTNFNGIKPETVFTVIDSADILVGALVVQPFWGTLHIKLLYVKENARGQGIGTSLIKQALAYGTLLGHPFAFVETMSFQALEFYQKMGFKIDLTRKGPYDLSFHYLRKDLV